MKEYRTINQIAGPLLLVENTEPVGYAELVNIVLWDGSVKRGQVLDTSDEIVVVQVFETTAGIGRDSGVRFTGETIKMPVGKEMLGRILSGGGKPIDGGPEIVPEKRLDVTGAAINPVMPATPPRSFTPRITGSIFGTASWAQNVVTASYVTGSVFTSTNPALTASFAVTADFDDHFSDCLLRRVFRCHAERHLHCNARSAVRVSEASRW